MKPRELIKSPSKKKILFLFANLETMPYIERLGLRYLFVVLIHSKDIPTGTLNSILKDARL